MSAKESSSGHAAAPECLGVLEGQQVSVGDFEEDAPLIDLRQLEGQTVLPSVCKTVDGIEATWTEGHGRGQRDRKSRVSQQFVDGLGLVSVLNSNQYSLEEVRLHPFILCTIEWVGLG